MPGQNKQYEAFLQFIKEHRGDEANFETIFSKLNETIQTLQNSQQADTEYLNSLNEVKEKQAEAYKQVKESAGSAWPEFEKFVTELERTITGFLQKNK